MLKYTRKVLALFLSICVISCSFTYVALAAPSDSLNDSLNDKISDLEKNVPIEFRLAME